MSFILLANLRKPKKCYCGYRQRFSHMIWIFKKKVLIYNRSFHEKNLKGFINHTTTFYQPKHKFQLENWNFISNLAPRMIWICAWIMTRQTYSCWQKLWFLYNKSLRIFIMKIYNFNLLFLLTYSICLITSLEPMKFNQNTIANY